MNKYIKSPLNYTGGKTKLLPQILPQFPEKINTFYDLFCGGANVGININANNVIYNDCNKDLVGLFKVLSCHTSDVLLEEINKIITEYNLSQSSINGYAAYSCNSSDGLGKYNKDKFLKLRNNFNELTIKDDKYYLMLYVIIIYAFNNQIRFNKNHQFNLPVGKRDFNSRIKDNFVAFTEALHNQKCSFTNADFREYRDYNFDKNDFIYCDPPYFNSTATYNEKDGWTEKDENDLREMLCELSFKGIKFALSNNAACNTTLVDWAERNGFNVHYISANYSNCNYHKKDKGAADIEVLITNY